MDEFTYVVKLDKKGRMVLPIFIRESLGKLVLLRWDGKRCVIESAKEVRGEKISKNGWEVRE